MELNPSEISKLKSLKLVYVEDEEDIRRAMLLAFSKLFGEVFYAENGQDAFNIFLQNEGGIDLIITDINMPILNGLEFAKRIRERNKTVPIVFATAYGDESYYQEAISLGVSQYIKKPFNMKQVVASCIKAVSSTVTMYPSEYKDVVDSTAIVSKTDEFGIITYVNDMFCKVSGYTSEELIGRTHNIIRHPDTPSSLFEEMWKTIKADKKVWHGTITNKRKNGEDYIVEARISPQIGAKGEITGYVGIRYDITELAREKELNEVAMGIQDQIVIIGKNGAGMLKANKSFFNTLRYETLSEFILENKSSIINIIENLIDLTEDEKDSLRFNKCCEIVAAKIKTKSGIKTFSVSIKNLFYSSGTYFVITLTDISNLQAQIDSAKKEAFIKSNFLATMSHEIRTPLNGVLPYLQLLLETSLTGEQKDYVDTISKSADQLLRIINDILDFSKIESGKLEIEEVSFEPIKEFESVISLFEARANEKKISFCAFVDPRLPKTLIGDSLRIKQVLSNLISNAIKFTPEEKNISVTVGFDGLSQNGDAIINFNVIDSGIGIDESKIATLFNPFSQADNSITRKYGGTGLGLSISQNLLKLMNSEIKLKSSIGIGSDFGFSLNLPVESHEDVYDYDRTKDIKIGIHVANQAFDNINILMQKYFDGFGMKYDLVFGTKDFFDKNCEILFVISSGNEAISWLQKHRPLGEAKIIAVMPSNLIEINKFYCDYTIHFPVNGSKIYDSILGVKRFREKLQSDIQNPLVGSGKKFPDSKVLVAEDNLTNQKIATAILKKFDISVDIANNGEEALSFIKSGKKYDLILMDIHMPIMNGIDAAKFIISYQNDLDISPTPIVALTADAIKGHEKEYFEAGMVDFIPKPIEREKFDRVVEKYLSIKTDVFKQKTIVSNVNKSLAREKIISVASKELGLDEEVIEMLLDDYYENWKQYKEAMLNAINTNSYEDIRSIAHAIKGSSGSMRINEVYEMAKEIEYSIKDGNLNADYLTMFKNIIDVLEQ